VQFNKELAISYCNAFVKAVRGSAVKLIVYNTTAIYPGNDTGTTLHEIRVAMEDVFQASGLPFITIRPTLYLNNFLGEWSLKALLSEGILAYPLPSSQEVAWTTHEMLAAYSVAAFEKDYLAGNRFDIGNYSLTGEEIALKFSTFIDRPVSYRSLDLVDFERKLSQSAGEKVAREVAESYRYVQAHPRVYNKKTTELLYETFSMPVEPVDKWFQRRATSILKGAMSLVG
jgi:uncharacterized protein YbjT (DUF2867 family)